MDMLVQSFLSLHDFKKFNVRRQSVWIPKIVFFSDFIDLWEAIGARKGVGRRTR